MNSISRSMNTQHRYTLSSLELLVLVAVRDYVCGRCQSYHWVEIDWINIMMHGTGYLSDKELEKFKNGDYELSYLCANPWCINPSHIKLESPTVNKTRTTCHNQINRTGKNANCKHSPKCHRETQMTLANLTTYVNKLQTHATTKLGNGGYHCFAKACRAKNKIFRGRDYLVHVVNKHSPGPISELKQEVMEYQCPNEWIWKDGAVLELLGQEREDRDPEREMVVSFSSVVLHQGGSD
jgi:hypothetical protein